jgi:hypothetical protein
MAAELVGGERCLDLTLNDETPAFVVEDQEIRKPTPVRLILIRLLVLPWEVLRFDHQVGRNGRQVQAQPSYEASEERPILVQTDA